ncbi:hypothetical protein FHX03_001765 [Rhizobium sp. BK456]|nr:hypothetical protein [Rhizobium sp. BK456]
MSPGSVQRFRDDDMHKENSIVAATASDYAEKIDGKP